MHEEIFKKMQEVYSLMYIKNNESDPVKVNLKSKKEKKDPYFEKFLKEREEYVNKLNEKKKNKYEKIIKKGRFFNEMVKYIFLIFTRKKKFEKIILKENMSMNIYDEDFEKKSKKYDNVFFSVPTKYTDTKIYFKQKQTLSLLSLLLCYQYLSKGGSFIFTSTFLNYELIKFAYLSTLFFDKVFIIEKSTVFLQGFKQDHSKIKLIQNIIKNNYQYDLKNMKNLNEVVQNIINYIEIDIYFKKELYLNNNIKLYNDYIIYNKIELIQRLGIGVFKDFKKVLLKYYKNI